MFLSRINRHSLVHGGGFRDPSVTPANFSSPQIRWLVNYKSERHSVAGIASIGYRLSRHPNWPQPDTPSTPEGQYRGATHPDHVEDVQAAITFLQKKFQFRERCVLVGHSVGATLAFLALTKDLPGLKVDITPPAAIVGVSGIYDFPGIVARHPDEPIYAEFITGALGEDRDLWAKLSPGLMSGTDGAGSRLRWTAADVIVLAYSSDDVLVEKEQVETMVAALKSRARPGRRDLVFEIREGHDELWQHGPELTRCITKALEELDDAG